MPDIKFCRFYHKLFFLADERRYVFQQFEISRSSFNRHYEQKLDAFVVRLRISFVVQSRLFQDSLHIMLVLSAGSILLSISLCLTQPYFPIHIFKLLNISLENCLLKHNLWFDKYKNFVDTIFKRQILLVSMQNCLINHDKFE